MDSTNSPTTKPLYRGTQVVWYMVSLLEALLAFRFVLKFLGANPSAGFSSFIYNLTYIFTEPFRTVFNMTYVQGSVIEWTTLLAMVVYWLLGMAIIQLFLMGKTISTPEAAIKMSNQEH